MTPYPNGTGTVALHNGGKPPTAYVDHRARFQQLVRTEPQPQSAGDPDSAATLRRDHLIMALHSQRDASIQAGPDAVLKGDLMIPDGADLTGAVVIAHASPRPRRNAFNLAAVASLREIGFATLLIDLLTLGEKTSASAPTRAELLAPRLGAATEFLRCQSETDRLAIGYVATGKASSAALLAAASLGDAIGAVVLVGARSLRVPLRPEEVTAPVLLIVEGTASELELGCATRDRLTCRSDVVMVPGATLTCKGDPRPRRLAVQLAVDWFAGQMVHPVRHGGRSHRASAAARGAATATR